ncbi:MAG: DNA-processing protein DprA, partial [Ardenticatenaceae bacterium]
MSELAYWIAFNRVPGIGPTRLRSLLEFFDEDLQAAWEADARMLARAGLDRRSVENLLETRRTVRLDREEALLAQYDVQALTWQDRRYPRLLREIPTSPPVLYVRGELTVEDEWAIAIVGTRRATSYGRQVTETLARGLAEAGLTIVSGLAIGVDGIAHGATLAAGGRTVAVLANGVEQPYPASNRKLAERIVAEGRGALVS